MYNKYLRELGLKPYYDFCISPRRIKNEIKYAFQRLTCGGCCSRDCWDLDTYSIEQLYTLLNIYLRDASKIIVLDDPKIQFEWEGRKISQKDAIIYIIASLGEYLKFINSYCTDFLLEEEWRKQAQKALCLYNIIIYTMWW